MSTGVRKAEFLRALDAGYELPPEEAESTGGTELPTMCEVLCKYPVRLQEAPPGLPAHAGKVWQLLTPYYEQKARLERAAWQTLAEGLSDREWEAMWRANSNAPPVACTLERLRAFPVLLDPALHPATDICPLAECAECSVRDCPHQEPLHYHHDGCPACWASAQGL